MTLLRPENIFWRGHSFKTGNPVSGHQDHAHVQHPDQKVLIPMLRWCRDHGARVSEHELFPGSDGVGVHRVHASDSWHYRKPSEAGDVNLGFGNPPGEGAFLDDLMARLWQGIEYPEVFEHPEEDDMPGEDYFNLQFEDIKQRLVKLESDAEEKRVQGITRLGGKLDAVLDALRHIRH